MVRPEREVGAIFGKEENSKNAFLGLLEVYSHFS